jgi:hypothetical protein
MSDENTKDTIEERKRIATQFRLTPRIVDELRRRQKANGSTVTAEAEMLISKGMQLEQLLQPKGRLALDVLISLLNDDPKSVIRKLLESGVGLGRIHSAVEEYKIANGMVQAPKFAETEPVAETAA